AGRSALPTYLTTVTRRVWLDLQSRRCGRWRPSVAAQRHGRTAVRLERLLSHDRLSFEEACQTLRINHRVPESDTELERLRSLLPARSRIQIFALSDTDGAESDTPCQPVVASSRSLAQRRAVKAAIHGLPEDERRLLMLRFRDGWSVSRLARRFNVEQKALY